jgi:glycosyltransferase involved in cell wall biosynthesis
MKILFVSNTYPPNSVGGYEEGCKECADALASRGHDVLVLTSVYGRDKPETEGNVRRVLLLELSWESPRPSAFKRMSFRVRQEKQNRKIFQELCGEFSPEVVYFWNLSGLNISLISVARELNLPYCLYVFDGWLTSRWQLRNRLGFRASSFIVSLAVRLSGIKPAPVLPRLDHVEFATKFLEKKAVSSGAFIHDSTVIHWGIHIDETEIALAPSSPRKLLYVGQIAPHKGVRTAIEALGILLDKESRDFTLTIVGGSVVPEYRKEMDLLAKRLCPKGSVTFADAVPRRELPAIYRNHGVLLFPSVWDEPFGIVILEAMSHGLAVVATGTGGSVEIVESNENALLFEKGNPQACADCVRALANNNDLYESIRANGRKTVRERFNIASTIDNIENDLIRISKQA